LPIPDPAPVTSATFVMSDLLRSPGAAPPDLDDDALVRS
jgi:hypothetical protein